MWTIDQLKELMQKEDELKNKYLEWAKKYNMEADYLGWEYYEMGLLPREVQYLYNKKLVNITSKSNKKTYYLLNRPEIEKFIQNVPSNSVKKEANIPDDLFDIIIGYDDLKRILKTIIRNGKRTGVMFVGPPASAKTMFLMELLHLPDSMFVTAYTTTKSGLRDLFIEYNPKYLAIDEIDKTDTDTTHTLLSALENGIVTKTTAREYIQVEVEPIIFATCNDERKISESLKSRFIIVHFPTYTLHELRAIGYNLLKREGIDENYINKILDVSLKTGLIIDPRDFIKIARAIDITKIDDIEKILDVLIKYSLRRKDDDKQER